MQRHPSAKRVISFIPLAAYLSLVLIGAPSRSQAMDECISFYRNRYGVSADEAIRQCRTYGMPPTGSAENNSAAIAEKCYQRFTNGSREQLACFNARSTDFVEKCYQRFTNGSREQLACFNARSTDIVEACYRRFTNGSREQLACFNARNTDIVETCYRRFTNGSEEQLACLTRRPW
jgi:hypothetical protein